MKVLFLVAYSELAASSRTRVYDYLPFLKKKGVKYTYICFVPKRFHSLTSKHQSPVERVSYYFLGFCFKIIKTIQALAMTRGYDILFIQKITFPFGLEKVLRLFNKNIIFDFDDAIFTNEDNKNTLFGRLKENFQRKSFQKMLKVSRVCLVENEYNKKIALEHCSDVEIIIGPIDTEKYFVKEKSQQCKVVIGWVGSYSTTKYLYQIKEALSELLERGDVILRLVGANPDFEKINLPCEIEKWSLGGEASLIQTFDIGIMPLPDNEWTRGKGGYKLLQYMAIGIPALASPVGVNKQIIRNGVNGFLADNKHEWVDALCRLVENRKLRLKMGVEGRNIAEREYSLNKASEKLFKIFKRI
jgi:glycosyltransferase involved in cell wall biosynthesis